MKRGLECFMTISSSDPNELKSLAHSDVLCDEVYITAHCCLSK